jgi:hypothetical protein
MRWLLWLGSVLLLILGACLLVLGSYVAVSTDSTPTHKLNPAEVARVRAARLFVEAHRRVNGRMPEAADFETWARTAPEDVRFDGVGFSYSRRGAESYDFSWWGGESQLRSKADSASEHTAEISPEDYFVFGSKWLDLLVFIGAGLVAIAAASVLSMAAIRGGAS